MPSAQQVNWAKFRASAVIVAGLLILGTLSFLLTGGTILAPKVKIYLYLPDATGVSPGSPVRVDGIGVGKVTLVELSGSNEPNRVIKVTMSVGRDRLASITDDSTAETTSDTIIGDKFVDVTSGAGARHLTAGGELRYKSSGDLMQRLDIAQFQQQMHPFELLLDDIEQGKGPLGEFIMGDNDGDADEKPVHRVQVGAFYMDTHELTQKAYEVLMETNPSKSKGPDKPVEQVDWYHAVLYCNMRSLKQGLKPCYDSTTPDIEVLENDRFSPQFGSRVL